MNMKEAVEEYPQIEGLLKDEFTIRDFHLLKKHGRAREAYNGTPRVFINIEADMEKPLRYEKEIVKSELIGMDSHIFTIKNK